jgi:Protein of unknown function (DUF992)
MENIMTSHGFGMCAAALACGLGLGAVSGTAAAQEGPSARVGTLSCDVSAGVGMIVTSSRSMTCRFQPLRGRAETYTGTVRRYGLELGATSRARMVWGVVAPVRRVETGALAGTYVGASASGSVGVGGGVNLLVGGSGNSFSLQPLSVQAQRGLNLAAGVSEFVLASSR